MPKKTHGHERDPKTGKITVTNETASRAARKTESVQHGDYVKDGLLSRLADAAINKITKGNSR